MSTRLRAWACPTQCGCVVQITTETQDLDGDGVDDFLLSEGATLILRQCKAHGSFATAADLYEEIRHFHGTLHSPDTCACSLLYVWDDREAEDVRIQTPMESPRTKRCPVHADLTDPTAHYDVVSAENALKNETVAAVAADLAVPIDTVEWSLDANRAVVIDSAKLGVTQARIATALSKSSVLANRAISLG